MCQCPLAPKKTQGTKCINTHKPKNTPGGKVSIPTNCILLSVIQIALMNAKYKFIWNNLCTTGNRHDSTLFYSTMFWSNIVRGYVLSEAAAETTDIVIPPLILGGAAVTRRSFSPKPYSNAVLSDKEARDKKALIKPW